MLENRISVPRSVTLSVILIGLVLLALTSFAKSEGQWVPNDSAAGCPSSGYASGCTQDQVCSDWDVDGEPLVTCCIEPEYLGSSFFGACN